MRLSQPAATRQALHRSIVHQLGQLQYDMRPVKLDCGAAFVCFR
jgi:hypothetical protein